MNGVLLRLVHEEQRGQRWHSEVQRVGAAVPALLLGLQTAAIAVAAAAVVRGVAVERLAPQARPRDADAVVADDAGQEMADDEDRRLVASAFAQECEDLIVVVVAVDPLETGRLAVAFVQRGQLRVSLVEVAHPVLDSTVGWLVEQMPVEALVVIPFAPLAELAAHEQQFLAGLAVHVTVQQAQPSELVPVVAGSLLSSERLQCTTSSCDSGRTK